MAPCAPGDWLRVDEAFAAQMALRDDLVAREPQAVVAEAGAATAPAARELLALVLRHLPVLGYQVRGDRVARPDGVTVSADDAAPMASLARLCQNDFCLLSDGGQGEHVLRAAALCFPAHWTLAQKLNRPLGAVHRPVPGYAGDLARRVQRLFDGLHPDRPLWRFNALRYADPALHQPAPEGTARHRDPQRQIFLRSERQCLLRLPESGAVVFSIHTYLLHREDLPAGWWDGVPG